MWTPIFIENNGNILTVLDTYIEKLQLFRNLINNQDTDSLKNLIHESNRIKRILKKS